MNTIYYKWPNPCNCGCQGQDPWHRATYKRVVKNIKDTFGSTEGFVKLPFSTKPVRVVKTCGVWVVDKSSITFDK